MKKLLFLLSVIAALVVAPSFVENNSAKAQIVNILTPIAANDTLTNTDTAWIYIVADAVNSKTFSSSGSVADNISRSATFRVTRASGTAAGSFKLQGSNDGSNWELIDTAFTLTNVVEQQRTFDLRTESGSLVFKYYRGEFISSGTNTQIPKIYYVRRSN